MCRDLPFANALIDCCRGPTFNALKIDAVVKDQNLASKLIMLAAELTVRGSDGTVPHSDTSTVELFEVVAGNLARMPFVGGAAATHLLKVPIHRYLIENSVDNYVGRYLDRLQ